MRCLFGLALAALAAGCGPQPPAGPAAPVAPAAQALASYAGPAFLENLTARPDGGVLFTNYTGMAVELLPPGGPARTFAALDVHPVSIIPLDDGYLVAAHATPFTAGPGFIGSGVLVTLDANGNVTGAAVTASRAGFLNGMVALPDGGVLIADSVKAQILRFDPDSRALDVWYADPELAPQETPAFRPGANGLKLRDGALIVSSSAKTALYSLAIGADGKPAGTLTKIVGDLPGTDDFAVLPEGGFIVATHGDRIVLVAPDGAVATLTDDPRILGSTAVGLVGEGAARRAIILGTGGFSEGGKADAVVLSVPAP